MFLVANCSSITGKILYSDTYLELPGLTSDMGEKIEAQRPLLNRLAAIPILGHLAGVVRIALAIFHIIGHTCAAVIFWNRDHLCHVVKGGAELLRGIIELLPIIGTLFVWKFDVKKPFFPRSNRETEVDWAFFLVKIWNPYELDLIDKHLIDQHHSAYFYNPDVDTA